MATFPTWVTVRSANQCCVLCCVSSSCSNATIKKRSTNRSSEERRSQLYHRESLKVAKLIIPQSVKKLCHHMHFTEPKSSLPYFICCIPGTYFYTVKIDHLIHAPFTIIYLYQYHHYMFRWSSHHYQRAKKVTGSLLRLKSYNSTFKKQSNVPVCNSTHAPRSL
jgi:hypothetical protein